MGNIAKRLLILNGLATVGMVFHHASLFGFSALFEWVRSFPPEDVIAFNPLNPLNYSVVLVTQLNSFVLPSFMFISGGFLAFGYGNNHNNLWKGVLPRIQKLLIPVFIWTTIHFLLLQRLPTSPFEPIGTYYYIPLLIQYYLLSPLLMPLSKNRWGLLLSISAIPLFVRSIANIFRYLQIEQVALLYTINSLTRIRLWLFPHLFFWFVLGLVVGTHIQQVTAKLANWKKPLLAAVLILGISTMMEYWIVAHLVKREWLGNSYLGIFDTLFALAVILCFLAHDKILLPFSETLSQLGSKSLGIYLANLPVIFVASGIMDRMIPSAVRNQVFYQGILIMFGLGIPILLMAIIRNSPARKAHRYIFG